MTDPLRDWWDSLSELDQFNAYRIEKSNADALALTREPGLDVDGVRAAWLALALGRRSRGGSDEWWEMPATLSEALAIAREYGVIAEEEATKYAALASEDRP